MNVKEFDQLLKRVNLEEDIELKQNMVSLIRIFLTTQDNEADFELDNDTLLADENLESKVTKKDLDKEMDSENIDKKNSREDSHKEEETSSSVEIKVEDVKEPTKEIPPASTTLREEISLGKTVKEPENNEEVLVESTEKTLEDSKEVENEQQEVKVEQEEVKEEKIETTQINDSGLYKISFGLPSTTKNSHLDDLVAKGGVVFREKRSFYLMLALDDEVVGLGRTQNINAFPEDVQNHLKNDGFLFADITSYEETESTSKRRYVDVELTNLKTMPEDHWIISNVNSLLESGEVPEGVSVKKEEPDSSEATGKEEVPEEAEALSVEEPIQEEPTVEEQPKEKEAEDLQLGKDSFIYSEKFFLNPNTLSVFENKRDEVVKEEYVVQVGDHVKLLAPGTEQPITVAILNESDLKRGSYEARILDYKLSVEDEIHHIDLDLNLLQTESIEKEYNTESQELVKPQGDYVKGKEEIIDADKKQTEENANEINNAITPTTNEDKASLVQPSTLVSSIEKTSKDTGIQTTVEGNPATTTIMGNLKSEAGELTETETVVSFQTPYNPDSWSRSVGKTVEIQSQLSFGGDNTAKSVSIIGKNGVVIAQGQVPINNALFLDGDKHSVEIGGLQGSSQSDDGFNISLLLKNFSKIA